MVNDDLVRLQDEFILDFLERSQRKNDGALFDPLCFDEGSLR